MKNVTFFFAVAVVIATIVLGLPIRATGETPSTQQKIRIGFFNTRAVAVAYVQSSMFNKKIAKIVTEANQAKANGNDKIYKKLNDELKMEQEKIHWQVYSNARIDDILMQVRPAYEQIAQKANVAAIAESVLYNDTKIELVDVTDLMVDEFMPSEKTKEKIQEILKKPPASFEQMKQTESDRNL
jgi:predicted MPP superfamily phosphohydrolase